MVVTMMIVVGFTAGSSRERLDPGLGVGQGQVQGRARNDNEIMRALLLGDFGNAIR